MNNLMIKPIRNLGKQSLKIRLLFIFLMVACILFSFNSKQETKKISSEGKWNTYENEYISMKYPSDYTIEDNFEVGADNLQSYTTDTTTATATNEIDILPCNATKDKPWLHIVLSRMKIHLPLRDFMQASIAFKGMGNEEVYQSSDIDSTSFAGLPALSVTFSYPQGFGDTLVQRQTIVQLPDYKLYYININCYSGIVHNSQKLAPVFKMLETLKFK